ncbi:MAG: hypothetical protein IJN17_06005 [Clostridia bacterium]|nr:hypothetical protein [Clostridia bacterium]
MKYNTLKRALILFSALLALILMSSCNRSFNASMGGEAANDEYIENDAQNGEYPGGVSGIIVNGDGNGGVSYYPGGMSGIIINGDGNGDVSYFPGGSIILEKSDGDDNLFVDGDGNEIIIKGNSVIVNGQKLPGKFEIQSDENGNMMLVLLDPLYSEEVVEETKPDVEQVTLPSGALANKEDVTYLEDGTVVVRFSPNDDGIYEHTSYLPDGSIVDTYYLDEEYNQVNYSDAVEIHAFYRDKNYTPIKAEYYNPKTMFRHTLIEYVYSEVEIGNPDTPKYLSSAVHTYFPEDPNGTISKYVEEFDPFLGSDKCIKKSFYSDGVNLSEYYNYDYSFDGTLKKETGYLADGSIFWIKSYNDNGTDSYFFSKFEDGTQSEYFYDENGVITLYKYVYTHGGTNIIHYKNGIRALGEIEMPNGNYQQTNYNEEGVEIKATTWDQNGNLIQVETYEYNDPPAYSKIFVHNKNNVLIGYTEFLSNDDGWVYSLETWYYDNGNIQSITETKDSVEIRYEYYDINGNRLH